MQMCLCIWLNKMSLEIVIAVDINLFNLQYSNIAPLKKDL